MPDFHNRYLVALNERVLVFDGAMGTSLQRLNLAASDFGGEKLWGCHDHLVLSKPQVVADVHNSFLAVGADVLETCTFRANRLTMREYGLQDQIIELNRAAAQLARRCADHYATAARPRFVAGSIGPSGLLLSADDPALSNITFDALAETFREQGLGLLEGGVDLLLIETSQDILEVKAAILGLQQAMQQAGRRVPLQAQVTLDTTGRMLLGTDIAAALATLERMPIDVIGLNCSTGPEHMREPIRYLAENAALPVACIPNAGLPLNVDGQAVYPLEPAPFAAELGEFVTRYGVSTVGGCCGTTPEHIQLLVEQVGGRRQAPRPTQPLTLVSSAIRATALQQDPPPMLIGERLNAQGSRKMKELLLADDYDRMVLLGREQIESGAHTLDVCVALTERADEAEQMRRLVKQLSLSLEAPLVVDTTEPEVVAQALQAAPGRVIVNAINMENGRQRIDAVVPLVRAYGAAVIALTIDEAGMAKTADRKRAVAEKIHAIVVEEYGLRPDALIFDDLTFTLATGEAEFANSAVETIAGLRQIKAALPGVLTSLGVSNVSFGFKPAARAVLNSVFLYHCVQAGLDMAIVNPKHITPYAEIPAEQRALADDLIFNRRPDALARFISFFEAVKLQAAETLDETEGRTAEQRVHWRILHRKKDGVEADLDEIVERLVRADTGVARFQQAADFAFPNPATSRAAVVILNTVLLPAMKEVGDKFGAGELILPFVLQSAEVMKRAVAHVEQFLERLAGVTKGTLVLATVYGDVHDIGKNLVKTIVANNGYTVHDLGKQVPANVIIDKAVEVNADAIGLSALLVSTSKQMPLIVQELHRRGLNIPVLIGGAAINRKFGRRITYVDPEQTVPYAPGVFYCKDAFEGLETIDRLQDPAQRADFVARLHRDAARDLHEQAAAPRAAAGRRSAIAARRAPIPEPPVWGPRLIERMPLELVFQCLDLDELYRLSWGAKNAHGAEWDALRAEFNDKLAGLQRRARAEGWFAPRAVYGYWPAQSNGDELLVYDPASAQDGRRPEVAQRFVFPRQPGQDNLCLADYFAPVDSGVMDVVAFQVVTLGPRPTELFDALQAQNNYSDAYFLHGLAVQTAEATAEYAHRHLRRELNLAPGRGKRYSWGYPAIPDLDDHAKVFALLPAAQQLGMALTESGQLVPEQSTAAIIVHHPEARYFTIGGSRLDQLEREMSKLAAQP
ncbi:MAG: methionine synthase [Anaerolineales bacterium]|nr:methionine synthase [Anaerolineales bacterium]